MEKSWIINFLYNSLPGRIILKALIRTNVSKFFGVLMDSPASKLLITGFIKNNNINMGEYTSLKYTSFNDFFTREIKKEYRPFPRDANDLAAPCDGRLTAYRIKPDGTFHIKNSIYTIEELLQDKTLADEFMGGVCLLFRLTPDDYHRYAFIDDGESIFSKKIKGVLHSVRPVAAGKYKVYTQNEREYTVIQTKNFGKAVQVEVGALFVGRIKNHDTGHAFKRGDEKGMFEFGGSTIVMLFQKNTATPDAAIYANTQDSKETIVRMGNKIGEKALECIQIELDK